MRIALTGATGHIGLATCHALLDAGHEVIALTHNKRNPLLEQLPIKIFRGDVLLPETLNEFMNGCDALVHTAGIIGLGYQFEQNVYDINVIGTKNILDTARKNGVKKIIHFSSIHVFSQQPYNEVLNESRFFVDDNSVFYDQTKRDAHRLAEQATFDGQHVVILCPTAVLGPYDLRPSKLGKAILDIYKGKIPAVVKGGFNFVDIRDIAKGVLMALEKGQSGESYILGGEYRTLKEFAELIGELKGRKKKFLEVPLFLADMALPFVQMYAKLARVAPLYDRIYLDILKDGNKNISFEKAINELNYANRPLKETLSDTIEWFRQQGKIKTDNL